MAGMIGDLWADFWAWNERHAATVFLFRGQADAADLVPKVGRKDYNYQLAREVEMMTAFARAARPFARDVTSDWERLALAQHHGDHSHIYPDLDGLCKSLDWRLKSGKTFSSIA